jgi:serine/threonine protein kinase
LVRRFAYGDGVAMSDQTTSVPPSLGPYRLVSRLGEGGMGVVHLGLDRSGRAVAVKVLREHVAHDPDARARLAREVSTLQRVRHPSVAEVIDADVDGDQPYVVTRFVNGPALDEVVRQQGPLVPDALTRLGRGLSAALEAIHTAGVVHRDLKPGNVLLLDGKPVVIDFGIAHVADDVRLTTVGLVMGTPGYLSPEVVDGQAVTTATDWWGWAATLAFAASGRPPFGRGPMDVVIDRVRRGQCDLDGVDDRLRPLLRTALAVDPRLRPGADEVLAALDRYAAGESATVTMSVQSQAARTWVAGPDLMGASAPPGEPFSPYSPATAYSAAAPSPDAESGYTRLDELLPMSDDAPAAPRQQPTGPAAASSGRRSGVVAAVFTALVGGALAFPVVAAGLTLVLCVVARTVERNRFALARRRGERGRRRSDGLVAALCSPWHLLRSVLMTAAAAVLPALLGLATAFSAGLALPAPGGAAAPGSLAAIGVGTAIALLAAWWGPGGRTLRRGTRTVLRTVVPSSAQVSSAVVLMAVAAGLAMWAVHTGEPQWAPLQTLPFGLPTR